MNFQIVEQANGDLVQMFGVFTEIGGLQYTTQQKAKAICKIKDDAGVEHKVHIYQGKRQLPSPQQFNQRHEFSLSTFQGTYQGQSYTGYSGFWQGDAQVNQPTPQKPRQAPSRTAEQPKPAKGIAESEIRLILVGAAIQSGQFEVKSNMDIEYWKNYIVTGRAPLPPSKIPDPHPDIQEPPPTGDEEQPY